MPLTMSNPTLQCVLIISNCAEDSLPGLLRISAGAAILPTSWIRLASRMPYTVCSASPICLAIATARSAVRRWWPAVYGSLSSNVLASAVTVASITSRRLSRPLSCAARSRNAAMPYDSRPATSPSSATSSSASPAIPKPGTTRLPSSCPRIISGITATTV